MGKWKVKVDMVGHADTNTILKYTLHLHNTNFSYLALFLQQHSLPDSGVDIVIVFIHL